MRLISLLALAACHLEHSTGDADPTFGTRYACTIEQRCAGAPVEQLERTACVLAYADAYDPLAATCLAAGCSCLIDCEAQLAPCIVPPATDGGSRG